MQKSKSYIKITAYFDIVMCSKAMKNSFSIAFYVFFYSNNPPNTLKDLKELVTACSEPEK
jgi:hypothetical protein